MPSIDTLEVGKAALLPWLAAVWAIISFEPHSRGCRPHSAMVFGLPSHLHGRRLTRIRITLRKSFFERSVVPIDVIVKMNDPILSYYDSTIYD
jgi:hypothetical protein